MPNPAYPSDPEDQRAQTRAFGLASMIWTGLFIENLPPDRCAVPIGREGAAVTVDAAARRVTVRLGRWTAIASDLGDGRGCGLN